MSFARPTLSDIAERLRGDIAARLPGADSLLRRSVLDVLARVVAGALAGLYGYLDWLARQLMPDTADAEQLTRWAGLWGVARLPATLATGAVRVTGVAGASVQESTVLVALDGQRFVTTAPATVGADTAEVPIAAELPGPVQLPADAALTFTSPVAGVNAIARLVGPLAGGAAEEGDVALRARLVERLRRPPEGGARHDYQAWMMAVPGVTRAWVYPGWMGPGTVGATFTLDGRADPVPTPADVAAVAAALEERAPVTAHVVTFAPTPVPFAPVIRLSPSTPEVRAAVAAELADLLLREAVPGGTLLVSHVREAISLAAGELDHTLSVPEGDVTVEPGQLLVPGPIEWL